MNKIFEETTAGVELGTMLVAINNGASETKIVAEMRAVARKHNVQIEPLFEEQELVGFVFPEHATTLLRWGPDPSPVWCADEVMEQAQTVLEEAFNPKEEESE